MSEPHGSNPTETQYPPHENFRTLGNETRLKILRVLWEAYDPETGSTPLTFSELRDDVGVADSGQFNYHLGKLTGSFISKSDGEYELTNTGLSLIQTIIGGTAIDDTTLEPTEIDQLCFYCGSPTVVEYDDEIARISCSGCPGTWENGTLGTVQFPPSGLRERSAKEVSLAAYEWNLHRFESLMGGVCPQCAGTTTIQTEVCPDHDVESGDRCQTCQRRHGYVFDAICRTCKYSHRGPFKVAVLSHQAVAAFFHNHDVTFNYASFNAFLMTQGFRETLVSEDPLRIEVSVPVDGDELHLVVDDGLNVLETSRDHRV